ncbi:TRAP-type C4-dicarboxylate transport system permease small subunit [Pseudomonas duriflava]|uniref:TRAP transporter small permease protein n=1 Tax=Pseudomonas duriflava TaxID=459528 RepID=A0A562Q6U7_9PSED|nr:TRAP transporter small permease [Pseudomonas duriflava]TWI52459.1 TRAP-type C4-dicarboxylate transport system permease small subunit [Pseudomonas duriflava]
MKSALLRVNDMIYTLCIWVAGLSILTISLIIPWGIFTRYVLGTGSSWPEPIAVLLMSVFTFIGAAPSYRAGAHMAVAMFTDRLPPMLKRYDAILVNLLMAAVTLFMTIWGIKLCMATWYQYTSELSWLRVGVAYSPIPIGGALTLWFVLEKIWCGEQCHRRVVQYDVVEQAEGAA